MLANIFAGAALAVTALAQDGTTPEQSSQAAELLSVVSVLQTALPSSLIQGYLTNSAEVSQEIQSEFSAGQTPSWFAALPSDVQTYLIPAGGVATANATAITTASGAPFPSANSTGNSTASRSRTLTTSASLTSGSSSSETGASGTGSSGSSGSSESSSSSGSGAMPTAVVGMGLAGAVGIVGLFAL